MSDAMPVTVVGVWRMPRAISGGVEPRIPCRHCGVPFTVLVRCPACGCPASHILWTR